MSDFIDRLLGAAPGIAAKGLAASHAGQRERRQDVQEDEDRRQRFEREAFQRSLLQSREERDAAAASRDAALHPARLRHMEGLGDAADELAALRRRDPISPEDRAYDTATGGFRAKRDAGVPLFSPRAPPRPSGGLTAEQRQERMMAGQIDDTRADLTRAEREGAPKLTRPMFLPKARESAFVADSSAAAGKINTLKQRSDSLTSAHDALVGRIGGRSPRPASPPAGYQDQLDEVMQAARDAVAEGEMSQQEADRLVAKAIARIKARYGQASP